MKRILFSTYCIFISISLISPLSPYDEILKLFFKRITSSQITVAKWTISESYSQYFSLSLPLLSHRHTCPVTVQNICPSKYNKTSNMTAYLFGRRGDLGQASQTLQKFQLFEMIFVRSPNNFIVVWCALKPTSEMSGCYGRLLLWYQYVGK